MNTIRNKFGYCFYEFKDDYVHIFDLYVQPQYRRKGVARKLLLEAIQNIRNTGWIGEIQIVCNPDEGIDKEQLKQFYKSLGLTVYEYYG